MSSEQGNMFDCSSISSFPFQFGFTSWSWLASFLTLPFAPNPFFLNGSWPILNNIIYCVISLFWWWSVDTHVYRMKMNEVPCLFSLLCFPLSLWKGKERFMAAWRLAVFTEMTVDDSLCRRFSCSAEHPGFGQQNKKNIVWAFLRLFDLSSSSATQLERISKRRGKRALVRSRACSHSCCDRGVHDAVTPDATGSFCCSTGRCTKYKQAKASTGHTVQSFAKIYFVYRC